MLNRTTGYGWRSTNQWQIGKLAIGKSSATSAIIINSVIKL